MFTEINSKLSETLLDSLYERKDDVLSDIGRAKTSLQELEEELAQVNSAIVNLKADCE